MLHVVIEHKRERWGLTFDAGRIGPKLACADPRTKDAWMHLP